MTPRRSLFVSLLMLLATTMGCEELPFVANDVQEVVEKNTIVLPFADNVPSEAPPGPHCGALESDETCASIAQIVPLETIAIDGGGVLTTVRFEDSDGEPLSGDLDHCLSVLNEDCDELASASGEAPEEGSLTTLLIAPGPTLESQAQALEVASRVLASRPLDERIAIFRWGSHVVQVTSFEDNRVTQEERLREVLGREALSYPRAIALDAVRRAVATVESGAFAGPRHLVVVAPGYAMEIPYLAGTLSTRWVVGRSEGRHEAVSAGHVFALRGAEDVVLMDEATVSARVAESLQAVDDAKRVRIGICSDGSKERIVLRSGDTEVAIDTPKAPLEYVAEGCDLDALPDYSPLFPERVEFHFSEAQRVIFDQRVAERVKDEFALSVSFSHLSGPVAASGTLRGASSLKCARKSYSINLDGPEGRRLMPGSSTDEFFLIALCLDEYYLNFYTTNALTSELGLFPLRYRLIELRIDGQSQGVYMMTEKPKDEVIHDYSRVRSVIRRDIDLDDRAPKFKYAFDDDEVRATDDYNALVTLPEEVSGRALVAAMERRMDLEQYLRWIALMTLLRNGDYVDEVYFFSTETADSENAPTDYYQIISWDNDDIFSECHGNSRRAIDDPHGLLYCAEGRMDHGMFANAAVYRRYVEILDEIIHQVPQERFDAAIDETVDALFVYLDDPVVVGRMVELLKLHPDATDPELARDAIESAATTMKGSFSEQRSLLLTRIEAWREAQ